LTGIARASLEELLLDYEKYLLQNRLRQWKKDSPEALKVRAKLKSLQEQPSGVSDQSDKSDRSDPLRLMHTNAQVAANIMLCLINQTSYLLGRQINRLEADFATEGGFTERLYRYRKDRMGN
jgi:four helix bundle suffix protein